MSSKVIATAIVAALVALSGVEAARATTPCLRGHSPYKLAGDTIEWAMKLAPGADCIQGLRWSTMQIYKVEVAEEPKNGNLVLVGPGFRYYAKPDFSGTDKFTLVVIGKNRHEEGRSTVEVTVSKPGSPAFASVAGHE